MMKIGFHGGEDLERIVARKHNEEAEVGTFLWGYGGSLCHPITQVAPSARLAAAAGCSFEFIGLPTPSAFQGTTHLCAEYSLDGVVWTELASAHRVTSSRYALVARGLTITSARINLAKYEVAVGACQGRSVPEYLRGRIDKVCARVATDDRDECFASVCLTAELVEPYAVFVR